MKTKTREKYENWRFKFNKKFRDKKCTPETLNEINEEIKRFCTILDGNYDLSYEE